MNNETLITVLTALVSAFGVKEIWSLIRKRMELKAKKEDKLDSVYLSIIKDLKEQIQKMENKVDLLIQENVELREEVAKLEILLKSNDKQAR